MKLPGTCGRGGKRTAAKDGLVRRGTQLLRADARTLDRLGAGASTSLHLCAHSTIASIARGEGAPFLGQRILDAHGRLRNYRPLDDPFELELLQPVAEHAIGDLGNGVAQRSEPAPRLEQDENDRAGPAAADELARPVKSGAECGRMRSPASYRHPQNSASTTISQVTT